MVSKPPVARRSSRSVNRAELFHPKHAESPESIAFSGLFPSFFAAVQSSQGDSRVFKEALFAAAKIPFLGAAVGKAFQYCSWAIPVEKVYSGEKTRPRRGGRATLRGLCRPVIPAVFGSFKSAEGSGGGGPLP